MNKRSDPADIYQSSVKIQHWEQAGEESIIIIIKLRRSVSVCVVCTVWSVLEDRTGQWIVWLLLLLTCGITPPSFPLIYPWDMPRGNIIKFLGCLLCVRLSPAYYSCATTVPFPGSLLQSSAQYILTYLYIHIAILTYVTCNIDTVCRRLSTHLVSLKQFTHNSGHSSSTVIPASLSGNASLVVSPLCYWAILGDSETQGKDLTVKLGWYCTHLHRCDST